MLLAVCKDTIILIIIQENTDKSWGDLVLLSVVQTEEYFVI